MIKNKDKKKNIYLASTILVVFFIYSFSLTRGWQSFDERLFHQETLFPIPTSFSEIFEVIRSFVLNYHNESMNVFFSNHMTIRSNQIASMLIVFTSYFLKKSALMYHFLQLGIHLINTTLVWLIFYKTTKIFFNKSIDEGRRTGLPQPGLGKHIGLPLLVTLFTCIWALHSASTEAVLLVTNWTTILTYTFCFAFLLYEISQITKEDKQIMGRHTGLPQPSLGKHIGLRPTFISILFCLTMFFTEYAYTLPLILFFILLCANTLVCPYIKNALSITINRTLPYFIGLILFLLLSFIKPESSLLNLFTSLKDISPLYTHLERNLWLVPQIFLHFVKLLIFPKTLSTYQSSHLHLANTLFEPYSLFCLLFYISFLIIPITLFLFLRNPVFKSICLLIYTFYFSLFPFLHIIAPTYCLSADRYCYFPAFFLLLILLTLATNLLKLNNLKLIAIVLSCFVFLITIRTLVRIKEWNDPSLLYKSAIKVDKNPLYKAQKLIVYGDFIGAQGNQEEMEKALKESLYYSNKALKELKAKNKRYKKQPVTLKSYGLDYDSLILKAAYLIATVKNDNYQEPPKDILAFYEPYISNRLNTAGVSQIALFADILFKAQETKKLKEILELGVERFPCSSGIMFALSDFYFQIEKDLDKTYKILEKAYKYFPNNPITLRKLQRYYETINDKANIAKFSYLLGLRLHLEEDYQKAALMYLDLNQVAQAHETLIKLAHLKSTSPFTLLLTSIYLDKVGNQSKSLELLNTAYLLSKKQDSHENIHIIKNILANLTKIYATRGDLSTAKKYLAEFQNTKPLSNEDIRQLNLIKAQFNL